VLSVTVPGLFLISMTPLSLLSLLVRDTEGEPDPPWHKREQVDAVGARSPLVLREVAGDGNPPPGPCARYGVLWRGRHSEAMQMDVEVGSRAESWISVTGPVAASVRLRPAAWPRDGSSCLPPASEFLPALSPLTNVVTSVVTKSPAPCPFGERHQ
jgi:hypothetical protein